MSIPPPPLALAGYATTQAAHRELDAIVAKYGQQCREDAFEEAAQVCDEAYDVFFAKHEFEVPKQRYNADSVKRSVKAGVEFVSADCATNIRSLK